VRVLQLVVAWVLVVLSLGLLAYGLAAAGLMLVLEALVGLGLSAVAFAGAVRVYRA
jgi:hypothetical protein